MNVLELNQGMRKVQSKLRVIYKDGYKHLELKDVKTG
jgi:hypothetical protein